MSEQSTDGVGRMKSALPKLLWVILFAILFFYMGWYAGELADYLACHVEP